MKVSWAKESKKKMVGDASQLATASAIRSFKARIDLLRRSPRDDECFDAVEKWLTKWLYTCNMANYMKDKNAT